ncbi:hypothetical protein BDV35DRAFT_356506 [Aspergillus flavus]|uniref:Hypervirulence associated protein TUDOR domain-containing protein n=3 Tax=Aspergillus subgen. Circumdati TaxID=2720871 RepID=A0A1S9DPD0_ASPOZ|nr:uncharacterized protein G4B84_006006 [Aspergillus flavus NRRL3357]EIT76134.1 hypothetical protein Ao3042_07838 [Aspergillus oryzae 3.042]KAB8245596.1 hypothetical protein BDV35DRAFT_356506 [Aspergillus flavus]KDE76414.1 hypothetical protein AO1008_02166 [Aspergillus oryzae 100-8]KOC18082.1 hypothetical protein AFLA70_30g005071 [Aspergillus flavus AF70]OOO10945.1 hypothetical protein OAory_01074150 [Aspergillus oryzae]|eukprot:EIT76134.1 hypothetical protein Ao3042_07838 [Aspergillus oryzae 3.042]
MVKGDVKDKHGDTIHEGDYVFTRIRGGSHQGEVERIVMDEQEAEEEGVKNPPKVVFHDQRGKKVAHNPETLEKMEHE